MKKIFAIFAAFLLGCSQTVRVKLPEGVYLPHTYCMKIHTNLSEKSVKLFVAELKEKLLWEQYLALENSTFDAEAELTKLNVKGDPKEWIITAEFVFKEVPDGKAERRKFVCWVLKKAFAAEEKAIKACATRIAYLLEEVLVLPEDAYFGKITEAPGDGGAEAGH